MLNDTTLGALFEDLASQGLNAALAGAPPSVPSAQLILDTFKTVARKGIAVAIVGKDAKKPEIVIAVRGGAAPPLRPMMDMVFQYLTQTRGPGKSVTKAGRTISIAGVTDDHQQATWDEGDDRVICDPSIVDRVLAVLDGNEPSAAKTPLLAELAKADASFEPLAVAFINVAPFGPLPPDAAKLGLDGVKRVDFRIGFQDDALVTISRAIAPAPRKGILALVDQPGFTLASLPPLPGGLTGFTAMSIDVGKTYYQVVAMIKANDPNGAKSVEEAEKSLHELLKMDLRRDVLAHMGPKLAFYTAPAQGGPEAVAAAMLDMRIAIQIDDPAAIGKALGPLMEAFNTQMRARPGQAEGAALEFVKTEGPMVAYTMKIPPNPGLPPQLTNLEPTVMVGKDRIVFATRREGAEAALAAGKDAKGGAWKPTEKFVAMAEKLPKTMVFLNVNDPREMFPALVSALPFLVQSMNAAIQQASRGNPNQAPRVPIEVDPAKIPDPADLTRLLFPGSFAISTDSEGFRVVTRDAFPSVTSPAMTGVAIGLLLPAVQAAREAARRAQCMNNMKQIALAMHNYHSANNTLPQQAITDKDGKPLLSWRVAILPYIEQQALYNKFKLDEPWDSKHNKPLLDEMPPIYFCTSTARKDGSGTNYQAFVGNNALFEKDRAVGFQDVTDGTSNTIMVVETKDSVPWTKPEDISFDPKNPAPGFGAGSFHPGGFNACFADGSVRFIKLSVNANVLRALITRSGGEVIAADAF